MDVVMVLILTVMVVGSLGARALYDLERARVAAVSSVSLTQPARLSTADSERFEASWQKQR